MADKSLTLRLNKVLRELNISLDRAVEYLSGVGCDIEARPTTKISKETYELLLEGFKIDKSKKDESAEISEEKRKEKENLRIQQEKLEQAKTNFSEKNSEIITASSSIRKFKPVGKIDLDSKGNLSESPKVKPDENKDITKKEFNNKNDKIQILFIGNDGSRDYEFVKSLVNKSENIEFNLISNQFKKDEFKQNVNLYNGSWVDNKISDEKIKDFYYKADLTIIPLIDTLQPSGQSVALQSIACGTPVLITKTSGFWDPSKFENKKNIIFCEKNDADYWLGEIESVCGDMKLMETLKENGIKTVESNYSLKNFYNNLKNYQSMFHL